MGVKAGDFFVNLGIKGSDKTDSQLDKTNDGFKKLKETSLATKAAILAAFYGLDKLAGAAGQRGTDLLNLSTITGISTKRLQEWAFALKQAGVSGESAAGFITGLQNSMFAILKGEGPPPWFLMMIGMMQARGTKVGPEFNIKNLQKNPELLAELAQKFALTTSIDASTRKNVLEESLGIGDDAAAALMRGVLSQKNFKRADQFASSDSQIKTLNETSIAMNNFTESLKSLMNELFGDTKILVSLFNGLTGAALFLKKDVGEAFNQPSDVIAAQNKFGHHVSVTNSTNVNIHGANAADVSRFKKAMSDVSAENIAILYNFLSLRQGQ